MTHRKDRLRVFLVGTEFFRSYGGIQYINRLLVRAFREMQRRTPLDLEVFSFVDGPEHFPAEAPDSAVRWHGASRERGRIALQFVRRLALVKPDLVLFTHVSMLPMADAVAALAPQARVAALAHGTEVWRPLTGRVARSLRRVDSWACPSAFTAEKLVSTQGIARERVKVVPHGLDPEWTSEAADRGDRDTGNRKGQTILSVTRLSRADREGKGIELVLRALPAVLTQFPGAHYTVVGGGTDLPAMADLIRRLGLEQQVELAGACGAEELRRAYVQADIFVLPTKVEGFGVVFLEAMQSGLPVVAARAAAAPEVVEDGVTGILTDPGNHGEIAEALVALLRDCERRCAMGKAGRQRVERMYRFEHFTARWEAWLASQAPEAIYTARQNGAYALAQAAGAH